MVEILAYKAGVFVGFFCFLIDDRAITFNARSSSETDASNWFSRSCRHRFFVLGVEPYPFLISGNLGVH